MRIPAYIITGNHIGKIVYITEYIQYRKKLKTHEGNLIDPKIIGIQPSEMIKIIQEEYLYGIFDTYEVDQQRHKRIGIRFKYPFVGFRKKSWYK